MRYAIVLCVILLGCSDESLPQAKYADGTPWEPIMPLSPGSVVPRDMDARQWDRFVAQAGIQADGKVKSFTPTWVGFASDPTGVMYYMDFGRIVMMWTEVGFAGNSNSTFFSLTGLPDAIKPSGPRFVMTMVEDNSVADKAGSAVVSSGGIGFGLGNVPAGGGAMTFLLGGWTNAGGKGLSPGAMIIYAK